MNHTDNICSPSIVNILNLWVKTDSLPLLTRRFISESCLMFIGQKKTKSRAFTKFISMSASRCRESSVQAPSIFFFFPPVSDRSGQPIRAPSASAPLPLRRFTGEGGPSAKEGSARRGEWMTSGGWRQHVWDWRVRSTQLGRDRTHSWLRPAFLHKTGLWEKGKIRPK